MIEQILRTTAPRNTSVSQTKDCTGGFESLMKSAVQGKDSKSAVQPDTSVSSKDEEKKDSDGADGSAGDQQLFNAVDVSLLAQLLQTGQSQPEFVKTLQIQPQTFTADPLLTTDTAQQLTVGTPVTGSASIQTIQPQTNMTDQLLTVGTAQQPAVDVPATDSAFIQTMADAASSVSAANVQGTAAQTDGLQKAPVLTDAAVSATATANVNSDANNTGQFKIPDVKSNTDQPAVQIQEVTAQSVEPEAAPATVQTKHSISESSSAAVLEILPKDASLSDEKTVIPMNSSQSQDTARFSDLYQTGNVVIKISDASSNAAKTTCNQVADKILLNYKAGNTQFQMDLYPQDLGKVSVKLAMQNGVLSVAIQASNPKTQSMLMENSSDIRSILQTTVSQPVQILEPAQEKAWYQQDQQNQQNQAQQQEEQRQSQNNNHTVSSLDGDVSTSDFLSVMQQLRQQVYSM
nr:flagellar hook-length control protein FliK [uncultured Caproiciproducens sp.]